MGKAVWGAVVAVALCVPAVAADHPSGTGRDASKLDAALRSRTSGRRQSVIVTVKEPGKIAVRRLLEAHGGKVVREHGIVNAITAVVDGEGLEALVNDPAVEHVSIDADIAPHAAPGGDTSSVVSNLKQMLDLGNWFTGSSVTVAVIDSGIAETTDFTGRIVGSYDFTNGAAGLATLPSDAYGHGTHVAGLAGSSGAISAGTYAGVAPGLKFLSLRVLDKNGNGKTSSVIAALQFAVANRALYNIRIINLSLGHPIYESAATDPLVQAVESAVRAGIVVVVAAGNYGYNASTGLTGYGGIASPGNSPSAITVGAASTANTLERTDDRVASFSSRGPSWLDGYGKPDVVAPGTGLLSDGVSGSTLLTSYPSLVTTTPGGKLLKLSGSSMATGVVSGLVAVMMEAHDYAAQQQYDALTQKQKRSYVPPPALTPNAIKAMLQYSATPLRKADGTAYDALTQGTGEVDGLGALILAYSADTSKPAGTGWMQSVAPTTQFGSDLETWAQRIVWGTRIVSGSSLVEINQAAWGGSVTWGSGELNNIVWGTASIEDDNIVWGTSLALSDVVWAGSVSEGDNIVWGTAIVTWAPNIVWGTSLLGVFEGDNIVWGTSSGEGDNIVWGSMSELDNIVWGTMSELDNIVWGTANKVMGLVLSGGVQ